MQLLKLLTFPSPLMPNFKINHSDSSSCLVFGNKEQLWIVTNFSSIPFNEENKESIEFFLVFGTISNSDLFLLPASLILENEGTTAGDSGLSLSLSINNCFDLSTYWFHSAYL